MELCNIPSVGMWFYHRAFPYAASDFQLELAKAASEQEEASAAIKDSRTPATFPFKAIREASTGRLIGEIGIFPTHAHRASWAGWGQAGRVSTLEWWVCLATGEREMPRVSVATPLILY